MGGRGGGVKDQDRKLKASPGNGKKKTNTMIDRRRYQPALRHTDTQVVDLAITV